LGVLAAAFGEPKSRSRNAQERINMRKLDRTQSFGTFKGQPFIPPGGDKIACYEQDGRHFDVNDREILPKGEKAAAENARRQQEETRKAVDVAVEAAELQVAQAAAETLEAANRLIEAADKMALSLLKSLARLILGPHCPAKKAEIVAALKALVASHEAAAPMEDGEDVDAKPVRADRTVPAAAKAPKVNGHKGVSLQSMIDAKPEAPPRAAPAAKPQPAKAAPPPAPQVNLTAWARGEAEYPFHDIRRSIEEFLGVAVTDMPAALEALIDKGVVAFKDARKDLRPPAAIEVEDQVDS
jgi:hypothetical protein